MGIPFTVAMGFLLTATMGKLFTMTMGIQLTISSNPSARIGGWQSKPYKQSEAISSEAPSGFGGSKSGEPLQKWLMNT